MKFLKIFFSCLALLSLSSCYNIKTTIGNYNLPTTVEKNPTKRGQACAYFIYPFSLFFFNYDLTVEKARQDGDIKNIISIESEVRYQYPFYVHRCILVLGN